MSCVNMKNIIKKIALFWATIAPGIFLVGYNIGTGSITTMASAGASYGMTLTWALALSCLFTYVLIIAFSRYTIITGKTALFSFKNNFGRGVTIFILFINKRNCILYGSYGGSGASNPRVVSSYHS